MACSIASRSLAAGALLALAVGAASARAEPPASDSALAQSLFDRGRELLDAGRTSEACELLAESYRLDPGGGTLLNLAVCLERSGKLASAYARFSEALSQAIRDERADRKEIAEEAIRDLGPRLSRLTVEVPPEARASGLEIRVDETSFAPSAWGHPTPIDGGEHIIEARAPGRRAWSSTFEIAPERERRVVAIPVLSSAGEERPDSPSEPASISDPDTLRCAKGYLPEGTRCVRQDENPYVPWAIASFVTGGLLFWGAVGTGYAWAIAAATSDDSTADTVGPLTLAFAGGTVLFVSLGIVLVVVPDGGASAALRVGPTGAWVEGAF